MTSLKRYNRARLQDGSFGIVVGLPGNERVFFWPDHAHNHVEVPAAAVIRVFGPGDRVLACGWERSVVQYTRNQSYRLREHKHGTLCDFYAWEIISACGEVPA